MRPSLRTPLRRPSTLRPLLFRTGSPAYGPSSGCRDQTRPGTFRCSAEPIHTCAALGLRSDTRTPSRARDPPRKFRSHPATPPRNAQPFAPGFVGPRWQVGEHPGHSRLMEPRHISQCRLQRAPHPAGFPAAHAAVSGGTLRGVTPSFRPSDPQFGPVISLTRPAAAFHCGTPRTMTASSQLRPWTSRRCWRSRSNASWSWSANLPSR